jgi:hypothetical protein
MSRPIGKAMNSDHVLSRWFFTLPINTMKSAIKIFFYLHIIGLILIGIGLYFLLYGGAGGEVNGMVLIAMTLGLGGLMISPYPMVKAIQWMHKEGS